MSNPKYIGKNVFNALNGGGDNVAIGYDGLGTLQGGGSNVAIGSNALPRGVSVEIDAIAEIK